MQLVQEMFLARGMMFDSMRDVKLRLQTLENQWNENLSLAIIRYSQECGEGSPTSEDANCMYYVVVLRVSLHVFPL